MDILITLQLLEQQAHHVITKLSMVGDLFSQTGLLIAIVLVSIKITIHITLTYSLMVKEHHILSK